MESTSEQRKRCNPGRSKSEQMKVKYKNIIQSAKRKNNVAEELALSNNEGRPLMVGVEGGVSTDPGGRRSHHIFIQVSNMYFIVLQMMGITWCCCPPQITNYVIQRLRNLWKKELFLSRSLCPTSRPMSSRRAEADTVRALYKRTLAQDIELKGLQIEHLKFLIKKTKLELEKLGRERQEWVNK
ncbi:hypothetical protein NQZ68_006025 [Dissostichus eleginoides]|nr:hypothetical protein NQZ68_006025 [Dissostichus eleginoides]